MLMRHASAGLPLMRTRTGSGLRQPGLMAFARKALTRMKGLMLRIAMIAVKLIVVMHMLAAFALNPKNPLAWRDRAFAYRAKGNTAKAIEDVTEAIRLDPNSQLTL